VEEPVEEPAVEEPVGAIEAPAVEEPDAEAETVQDDDAVDVDPVDAAADEDEDDEAAADEADEAAADEEEDEPAGRIERSAATAEFWAEVRIAPVEIALPRGSGYTLRAYRMSNELAAVELDEREDEFAGHLDEVDEEEIDPELLELLAQEPPAPEPATVDNRKVNGRKLDTRKAEVEDADDEFDDDDDLDVDDDDDDLDVADDEIDAVEDEDDEDESDEDDEDEDEESASADEPEEADDEEDDEDEDVSVEPAAEEVPVFLGHRGRVYVFESPQTLVDFVAESDEHDLAQLDTWAEVRERLTVDDIVPEAEDRYELDLVVENLRGGADALDYTLLIQAGEVARDIAYATRLEPVIAALSPGSRLDDLDEALRTADGGGLRGFLARRRLRRIVTQQTALGWRTIIGKISAVVDWRN
jgi:hypothetical protein